MSRIGLKYISSTSPGFPAVNPGRWNRASNFRNDLGKVLSDSGIDEEDCLSVAVYFKLTSEGKFLCAARREESLQWTGLTYEALWMFIPINADIPSEELASSIEELVSIFKHKEAFVSPEAFVDSLPSIFLKDFPEVENKNVEEGMRGHRVGFLSFESLEELKIILSGGFRPQYENFGLLLLTDNPVRVETTLPRIVLPELILAKELKSISEGSERTDEDEDGDSEMQIETEPGEEAQHEEGLEEEKDKIETPPEDESVGEFKESGAEEMEGEDNRQIITSLDTPGDKNDKKTEPRKFSFLSFILGMVCATLLFIVYLLLKQ